MPYIMDPDLAELHGAEAEDVYTLRGLLQQGSEKNPDGEAVVSLYQPADHLSSWSSSDTKNLGYVSWTYSELYHAANRLATLLHGSGTRKGSVVATFLSNSIEWCVFFWAAVGLGATFAPLDPRIIERPAELERVLRSLGVSVLAVEDTRHVEGIEKSAPQLAQKIALKMICHPSKTPGIEGWQEISDLRDDTPLKIDWDLPGSSDPTRDIAIILFTGGTTGQPKACPYTATMVGAQALPYLPQPTDSKLLLHNPNFHVACLSALLRSWTVGATVVIPSPKFDAGATLKGISSQACTHVSCTPSMMHAILSHPLLPSHRPTSLKSLVLAAEMVTPDLISRCQTVLGPQVNIKVSWGMTEAISLSVWDQPNKFPTHNGFIAVGNSILRGCRIRICETGNRRPLHRGTEGEIHCSGLVLIDGYLNEPKTESFYTDEYGNWFVTGDRGMIDQSGCLFILGRYKDIIIRGGENISATAIETCLDTWGDIRTQVVGIKDSIMGETPVAVVKQISNDVQTSSMKSELRDLVRRHLGTHFALGEVLSLEQLGLDDFPLSSAGKVRKLDLKDQVEKYLRDIDHEKGQRTQYSFVEQLTEIWSRILGCPKDQISPSMSAFDVADSLTIMVFCSQVEKVCQQRMSFQDIRDNSTLQSQASLLERKQGSGRAIAQPAVSSRSSNPPSEDEIAQIYGKVLGTQKVADISKAALQALNLNWQHDVEDVYCNNDFMRALGFTDLQIGASNLRWAFSTKDSSTVPEVRTALEIALTRHAPLRSIYVVANDNLPIHLIISPSQHWFDQCISEREQVDTIEEMQTLVVDLKLSFGSPPGPLFQAVITHIKSTGKLGVLFSIHHSTFDAFSIASFFGDLDTILDGDTSGLGTPTPFTLYADMYHLHSSGRAALDDVRHAVGRLHNISDLSKYMWPIKKGPKLSVNGTSGGLGERELLYQKENKVTRNNASHKDVFVNLKQLKEHHSVHASTVVKAAIALFNTEMTGQQHAIFCNTHAARTWPFLETWAATRLPNPATIAGPTLGCIFNVLPLKLELDSLAFLRQVQDNQAEQSLHVNAPVLAVQQQLGDDMDIGPNGARRQVLNWDPSLRARARTSYKSLQLLGKRGWVGAGILWNFGMPDDETITGLAVYNDEYLSYSEASEALARVFDIVHWMTKPENWSKKMGECRKVESEIF